MKYRVGDVANINVNTINKEYKGTIQYIDTGAVNEGKFNSPKVFSSLSEAPSRARRLACSGDTIISTVRPNMKHFGFITESGKYVYSTGFAVVSPISNKVDPYYLYLALSTNKVSKLLQSIGETSTSTYPSVKPKDIANLIIDLPSLGQQHLIAHRIHLIDQKEQINRKINANLVDLISATYNKFCDDFPATKRKTVKDIFDTKAVTYKIAENKNTKVWHFSIPNFDNDKVAKLENTVKIKSNKKLVNEFSVLISKLNPRFKRIWAPNLDSYQKYKSVASPEFVQVSGQNAEQQAVAFAILNSKDYSNFLISNATGSTNSRQRVKPQIANSYKIPFNTDEMKKLGDCLSPLLQQVQKNETENADLQSLKDTLLSKLF